MDGTREWKINLGQPLAKSSGSCLKLCVHPSLQNNSCGLMFPFIAINRMHDDKGCTSKWVSEAAFHLWKCEFISCCTSHVIVIAVFSAQFTFIHIISTRCCLRYVTSPTADNKRFAFISNVTGLGWQGCFMWTTKESGSTKVLTIPLYYLIFCFCNRVGFFSPDLDSCLVCLNCTKEVPVSPSDREI